MQTELETREVFQVTLKAARVNAGMTRAEAGNVLEKSTEVIKSLEVGKREIFHSELLKLCEAYHCTPDNIFLPINTPKSELLSK